MKLASWKVLISDKLLMALSCAVILILLLTILSAVYAARYEGRNRTLAAELEEIRSLSGRALQIKSTVSSMEKKLRRKKTSGVVSTLEGILKPIGMKASVLKPLGKHKVSSYNEENAELQIEGADLNSIVNLLYRIDTAQLPLKIKAASVKSTFEDPDKFILKLTVSLISA